MHTIDLGIIFLFLVLIFIYGTRSGRHIETMNHYFSGDRTLPWWAVSLSIVATETSVLTFLSIPALSYMGNFFFLQLTVGYILGRYLVVRFLLPLYIDGQYISPYQAVGKYAGRNMQRLVSAAFLVTRLLADGVRLFAVAIPLSMITGWSFVMSIWVIGAVTLIYTLLGGIKAVVWMDVAQWIIYITAALVTAFILLRLLKGMDIAVFSELAAAGKLRMLNFNMDFSDYNPISGLLGGALLSMSSHGTDQLIVQRVLSCRNSRESALSLLSSGYIVFIQFSLFLFIGSLLWLFWQGADYSSLGISRGDELFTKFIIENLPPVVKGITVAGIFAAAMSTLSSSLNALASSTMVDILPDAGLKRLDGKQQLKLSRAITFVWGFVMIGGASLFTGMTNPLVEIGLGIASFTYGSMLALFLLLRFFPKGPDASYMLSFFISLLSMILIIRSGALHYTWYIAIGVSISFAVWGIFYFFSRRLSSR